MMTDEYFKAIEEYGYLQMTPDKVRVIMQITEEAWINSMQKQDALFQAYYRGVYKAQAKFRKNVFDLAERNSSQAQEMVKKFIDERAKSDL